MSNVGEPFIFGGGGGGGGGDDYDDDDVDVDDTLSRQSFSGAIFRSASYPVSAKLARSPQLFSFSLFHSAVSFPFFFFAPFNKRFRKSIRYNTKREAKRDIVLLNAAAAIYVSGTSPDIEDALVRASESIDSGKAYAKLEELVKATQN